MDTSIVTQMFCLQAMIAICSAPLVGVLQPAPSDPDRSARAAASHRVDDLIAAFRKRDVEAVMACWSEKSPHYADVRKWVSRVFAGSLNLRVDSPTLAHWEARGDTVGVRLRFDSTWEDQKTRKPRRETVLWKLTFKQEGGVWKCWARDDCEDDVVDLLGRLNAARPEDRKSLLVKEKELITEETVEVLLQTGISLARQGKLPEAERVTAIATETAELLGLASLQAGAYLKHAAILQTAGKNQDALKVSMVARGFSQKAGDRCGEATALTIAGRAHREMHEFPQALACFEESLERGRGQCDKAWEASTLNSTGIVYEKKEQYAKALDKYGESLKIYEGLRADELQMAGVKNNVGHMYRLTGNPTAALEKHQASLGVYRRRGEKAGESQSLNGVGLVYLSTGEYKQAADEFRKALEAAEQAKDRRGESMTRLNLGLGLKQLEDFPEAFKQFERLAQEAADPELKARSLRECGRVLKDMGRFDESFHRYEDSEKISRTLLDWGSVAACEIGRGNIYERRALLDKARDQYQKALDHAQKAGSGGLEGQCWGSLGNVHKARHEWDPALECYDKALAIFESTGARSEKVATYNNMGIVFESWGQYHEAAAKYESALQLALTLKSTELQASVLGNVGNVHYARGDYAKALEVQEQSRKLAEAKGYKEVEAAALGNIGRVHAATGDFRQAVLCYGQARDIFGRLMVPEGEATCLNNLAAVYLRKGDYGLVLEDGLEAQRKFKAMGNEAGGAGAGLVVGQALALTRRLDDAATEYRTSQASFRRLKMRPQEQTAWGNLAIVLEEKKDFAGAIAAYDEALHLATDLSDRAGQAGILGNIGILRLKQGDVNEALKVQEKAAGTFQELGMTSAQALALSNLAHIRRMAGDHKGALDNLKEGVELARGADDLPSLFLCLANIGLVHYDLEEWRLAADSFQAAMKELEQIRVLVREPSLKISFFEQYIPVYALAVKSLAKLGPGAWEEAFAVNERARSRALMDVLGGGRIVVTAELSKADRQQEDEFARPLRALTNLWAEANSPQSDILTTDRLKIGAELEKARRNYEKFRREIFFRYPGLKTQLGQFQPVTLAKLGSTAIAGRPRMILLSYLVGNEETFLFTLRAGPSEGAPARLTFYRLGVTREQLKGRIDRFWAACARDKSEYKEDGCWLYKVLLGPAQGELDGKDQVVIVPDDCLYRLPFQALVGGKPERHLVESHAVTYAPSVSALVATRESTEVRTKIPAAQAVVKPAGPPLQDLLAMGDPIFPASGFLPLPKAKQEVQQIAKLFGSEALTGLNASEGAAKSKMGSAQHVHFATHGVLDDSAPLYSYVALAKSAEEDGFLHAFELVNLRLKSNVVVLSACHTAEGRPVRGEGLLGLTWSLAVAGSLSTVATLWQVESGSTTELMVDFYKSLKGQQSNGWKPLGRAEALRRAQCRLLTSPGYSHPYYWASFVLSGDMAR